MLFFEIISSFSFNANDSNGDWTCTEASLDIDGQFGGKTIKEKLSFNCSDNLEAPTKYSYSCITVTFRNKDENGTLTFKNFQVRRFCWLQVQSIRRQQGQVHRAWKPGGEGECLWITCSCPCPCPGFDWAHAQNGCIPQLAGQENITYSKAITDGPHCWASWIDSWKKPKNHL